ncbi:hypothetical protein AALP_AA5G282300 [Arabis alpina]|uniref:BZIP domain-containing protein n=1 Tax=Arabis alpina TaxID=50452 RepID=A0A087GZX0_ARAAL|nr:hypothetical protein AALP_AA5G282300 [Arabis alpina]
MGSLSPESDNDPRYASVTDERKRKRMISNRESARRSRMRKQKQLGDLINEVTVLKNDIGKINEQVDVATRRFMEMESKNDVMRAQALELTDRLRSLNSVIEMVEEISGQDLDKPEIPQNPWQIPCPLQQPILASMFDC